MVVINLHIHEVNQDMFASEFNKNCSSLSFRQQFTWSTQAWGSCSVTCGQGVQTRKVECIRLPQRQAVVSRLCSSSKRPAASRSCEGGSNRCPSTATWKVGPWGPVSLDGLFQSFIRNLNQVLLGQLYQQKMWLFYLLNVTMARQHHIHLSSGFLSLPSLQCSVTCGSGEQQRQITCVRSAPSQNCPAGRPAVTRSCRTTRCPKVSTEIRTNDPGENFKVKTHGKFTNLGHDCVVAFVMAFVAISRLFVAL